jgi:hypothetical protein
VRTPPADGAWAVPFVEGLAFPVVLALAMGVFLVLFRAGRDDAKLRLAPSDGASELLLFS